MSGLSAGRVQMRLQTRKPPVHAFTTARPHVVPRRSIKALASVRGSDKSASWRQGLVSAAAASMIAAANLISLPALASEKIGEFAASGIIFKDSVQVMAIDDPEVKGVTIYVSDFSRNFADKLSNLGNEPSSASVTCALTGPVIIKDPAKIKGLGKKGEDVFSEKKGLGFIQNKTLHVRRIFDEPHKSLLYVAYSTRLTNDKDESPGKYKTSICALPVSSEVAPVEKSDLNKDSGLFAPAENTS